MSVLEDLTPPRDGGPLVVNDLNDSGPPPVGPQPGPQSGPGAPPSQYGGKGPFPATVEDYPDEDDALARNTSPRPAAATADIPTTSPTTPQKDIDAREPNEHYAPVTHDSPLPPFIQLQGLPPPEHPQPEAFRYLDADSPVVTPGAIRRSVASSSGTNGPHPISPSVLGHSSVPSSHLSDVFSQATRNSESHCSWGPEHVVPQRGPDLPFAAQLGHESPANYGLHEPHSMSTGFSHGGPAWHTSPEMAYGNINTTPFTSHATPAVQSPYFSQPPLHPQKPALTGYQHLALKLAGTVFGFPSVTPIYRRFEALNHRLLLQLQDEIVELEQQLDSIDAADTSSRAMPMGFIPASRRGENMAQGELGWQKQEILSKIGWKLSQYSKSYTHHHEPSNTPRQNHLVLQGNAVPTNPHAQRNPRLPGFPLSGRDNR